MGSCEDGSVWGRYFHRTSIINTWFSEREVGKKSVPFDFLYPVFFSVLAHWVRGSRHVRFSGALGT
jgi:hypothetical protein